MQDDIMHYAMLGDVANIQDILSRLTFHEGMKALNEQIRDQEDNTPLHIAVIFRRTAVAKLLVSRGASVISLNINLMMPISYCQDKEMFNALISCNADRPLMNMMNIYEVLVSSSDQPGKGNMIIRTDCKQRTLLHYAALFCRDTDVFTTLISLCGREVASVLTLMQDFGNATFLHLAAQVGNTAALDAVKDLEYAATLDGKTCEKLLCGGMEIKNIDPIRHVQDMELSRSISTTSTTPSRSASSSSKTSSTTVTILMQQEMDEYKTRRYRHTQSPAMDALLHNKKEFFDKVVHMRGDTSSIKVTIRAIFDKLLTEPVITKDLIKRLEDSNSLESTDVPILTDVNEVQKTLLAVVPVTYVALYAGKFDVFHAMLRAGIVPANQWDPKFKRTCLHWAILHNREEIVNMLLSAEENNQAEIWRPSMSIQDVFGKTPAQIAFEQNNQNLLQLPAFKEHIEELFRDREIYVQAVNAILVAAALITSVTFAGWLQRPSDTFKRTAMQVFFTSNSISFYSAVAAMCVAVAALLPTPTKYVGQSVSQLRLAMVVDAVLLALSLSAVTASFSAAGFSAIRDNTSHLSFTFRSFYKAVMIATASFGSCVCGFALLGFLFQLISYLPSLPDMVFIFMPSFAVKFLCDKGSWNKAFGRVGESSRQGYKQATIDEIVSRISEINVVPAMYKAPENEDNFLVTKKNLVKRLLTVRSRRNLEHDKRRS